MKQSIYNHPCYNEQAKKKYARVHVPVVKSCNISCGYCNRLYSCPNENRPGVTTKIISPDIALQVVQNSVEKFASLTVVGVAGPGEALAEPETVYKTFKGIAAHFPYINFCLSTNGYALPENVELIRELGIDYVTVTVNTVDPATAGKIYSGCDIGQLLQNQKLGIKLLSEKGVFVKVNTVAIPEINTDCIAEVARMAAECGAYAHNIMPLYPVAGSVFENIQEPSDELILRLRTQCGAHIRQLSHCNRCRADACGYLC